MISIAHLYGFILYNDWFLWLFLAIITVGWIYFERQAQIVNKSVIRFATGALIALSLSVANIIISGLVIIWLVVMVSNLLI
jgi:hypothetical protein